MLVALFIGNLAADAVLQKGNTENYLSFRAASSRKYNDPKTGQPVEFTQWVTVNINRNYQGVAQYLVKGTKVFVEGQFSTRIYQDRSGMSQVGITINASRIELCGSPSVVQQQQPQPQQLPSAQQYRQQTPAATTMQQTQVQTQGYQQLPAQGMQQPAAQSQGFIVPPSETDMFTTEPFL